LAEVVGEIRDAVEFPALRQPLTRRPLSHERKEKWEMKDLGTFLIAIRCKFCEKTIAAFRGDNKTALQKAVKDKVDTLCPRCRRPIDKDAILTSTVLVPDDDGEGLEAARRSGVLYE